MKDKPKKKRKALRALGTVLLLAMAVLAVALAVRSQREGGVRALWRELFGSEGTDEFFFENASGGQVADMSSGLAVAAGSGLYVYDKEGELTFSRLYSYQDPAMTSAGDYGAVWNVGGDKVIFFTRKGIISELDFKEPVVSASVNELGYLAVCTEESAYYGSVTVYNYDATAIYRWYAGSSRILSARVDGRDRLLVLTVGTGGSGLKLLELNGEKPVAEYTYPGLIFDAAFTDAGFVAVTGEKLIGLDEGMAQTWEYSFDGRYLTQCRLRSGAIALGLSDFLVGGGRRVVIVSPEGEETASAEMGSDITDMCLAFDRVAVLSGGQVAIYDRRLNETGRYECDPGAEHVVIRDDGSVLCAGTFSAYVYGK